MRFWSSGKNSNRYSNDIEFDSRNLIDTNNNDNFNMMSAIYFVGYKSLLIVRGSIVSCNILKPK